MNHKMKRKIFFILILILKILKNCETQEIKGCFIESVSFAHYSVKLVCGDSSLNYNKNECYSKLESNKLKVWNFHTGDCRGNRLQDVISHPVINMNSFDISFYGVEQLSADDFNYSYLDIFNASHNKLKLISSSLFKNSGDVYELDLSFNNLSTLEIGAFSPLITMFVLNLKHNVIKNIDRDLFN